MKGKDLFMGLKYVGEDLIMEAEREGFPARKRSIRRPVLLAAVIALMLLLVGCGIVYVLRMQDLKIGEGEIITAQWEGTSGTQAVTTEKAQVLTFSGLKGTANYEAARQWYAFTQTYDPDWRIYHEYKDSGKLYRGPEEYSLYRIYTPEMQAKIDEITAKHGLKLTGKPVEAFHDSGLFSYLGLEGVLLPGAKATSDNFNTAYYDGGWFHTDMRMQLTDSPDWPFQFLCSLYYSPKDCFDSSVCELIETEDWQEWNYTTASGNNVLVIRSPYIWASWVFCDRGDATITLRIETILEWYDDSGIEKTPMTDDQLKQVLDCIDFSIRPQPGDPALLEAPDANREQSQTQKGYALTVKDVYTDGDATRIILGIAAPEGVDLEQFVAMEWGSIRFDAVQFTSQENANTRGIDINHGPRFDHDGDVSTIEYWLTISNKYKEGLTFQEGSIWRLYLDDLLVQEWSNDLNQWQRTWESEGIWNFELSLDQGDWRELEFISTPIETAACTGWDMEGNDVFQDVTVTTLKLRTFGGRFSSTWQQGELDFSDPRQGKFPMVVLKDGRTIRLSGDFSIYNPEEDGDRIPLNEVDHLLLMDGTKLNRSE